MSNNNFPELDGWDEIRKEPAHGDALGIIDATHRLVMSITNLRSAVSSQLGHLKNKIEHLQNSVNRLNQSFIQLNENIKKAGSSSTKLATALNRLTLWGVLVVGTGILLALIQFLFENKIWPFSQ